MDVLQHVLSRAAHIAESSKQCFIYIIAIDIFQVDVERIIGKDEDDKFFGPIVKEMKGENASDPKKEELLKRVLPLFEEMECACCTTERYVFPGVSF